MEVGAKSTCHSEAWEAAAKNIDAVVAIKSGRSRVDGIRRTVCVFDAAPDRTSIAAGPDA